MLALIIKNVTQRGLIMEGIVSLLSSPLFAASLFLLGCAVFVSARKKPMTQAEKLERNRKKRAAYGEKY